MKKFMRYFVKDKETGLYIYNCWSRDAFELMPFNSISGKLPDLFTTEELNIFEDYRKDIFGEGRQYIAVPVSVIVNEDESYEL